MEGIKSFTRSKEDIINAIYDIIELQKGDLILSDKKHGLIHFELTMYGYLWELLYKISDMGTSKCEVSLRVIGERKDKAREIRREFALLDAILNGGADVMIIDN